MMAFRSSNLSMEVDWIDLRDWSHTTAGKESESSSFSATLFLRNSVESEASK